MIQANELRVSNLVKRNDMPGIFSIRGVCKDRIHPIELEEIFKDAQDNKCGYACQCTLSELDPIRLSDDILEISGFELPDKGDYYGGWLIEVSNGHKIRITQAGSKWFWYMSDHVEVETTYIHQLQNLYFSLTGEELNINL